MIAAIGYLVPVVRLALSYHETYGSWSRSVTLLMRALYRPLMVIGFLALVRRSIRAEEGLELPFRWTWLGPLLAGLVYAVYSTYHIELAGSLSILMLPLGLAVDVITLWLLGKGLVRVFSGAASIHWRAGSGV